MNEESGSGVLRLVAELSRQLHPNAAWMPSPTPASSLDCELGLDSLARLELLTRLRQTFGEAIAVEAILVADSVADVMRAVEGCGGPPTPVGITTVVPHRELFFAAGGRQQLRSVPEILSRLVERDPQFVCVRLLGTNGTDTAIEAGQLLAGARRIAAGVARRISVNEPVALMLPTGRAFIEALFGIQMAGGIPVPLAPAVRPSQIEDHLQRQVGILDDCRAGMLIASREVTPLARMAKARAQTVRRVLTVEQLRQRASGLVPWRVRGADTALLQYTSGSTGKPKGVVLTHANLLANLEAIARALCTGPSDTFVSWLPLYHDMGLIGGLLHPLYCGIPLVLMSPLAFLGRPELWIEAMSRFHGTMTVAPNFAYEICQRRAGEVDLSGVALGHWRLALNGAEPVSPATIDRFCSRFEPLGFRRDSMLPVYGLAEDSLAVTFPALGRAPLIDRVRRDTLLARGLAEPAEGVEAAAGDAAGNGVLSFVSCGVPIHSVELRVIDEAGCELAEREVGRVQFRGPSATSGYYLDPEATRELFDGNWIESGDLGYLAGGELYLTGRSKDIIIHAGRNLSPHSLEEAVGEVAGIRKGCVAAFGVADADLGTERLIVVAETRERYAERRGALMSAINEACMRVVGVAPDDVCLVAPHTLLKTSSGKIRRVACRSLYASGELARGTRRAAWRQIGATLAGTAGVSARRAWRGLPAAAYSAYAWCLAGALVALAWFGVLALPRLSWRRRWACATCRSFFRLAALPLTVSGRSHLSCESGSDSGLVMVANHASFLDSMILMAAVDVPLSFVAKQAFERFTVTRLLMRRLGTCFVDPDASDPRPGLDEWAERVRGGEVLVVFAEGTFVRAAGLRPFKLGAFEAALRARRPLLPVVINGSRRLLRDEQWWIRRSAIDVHICAPLEGAGTDFAAAVRLRGEARQEMLRCLDEADLESTGETSWSVALDSAEPDEVVAEGAR